MDKADALRLVVFEYLLPMQRERRVRAFVRACRESHVHLKMCASRYPAGTFEEVHILSDRLLAAHGFATSYIYPHTMVHENHEINRRRTVCALVDSEGPFRWNPGCTRVADPTSGIRTFRPGDYMCHGRLP